MEFLPNGHRGQVELAIEVAIPELQVFPNYGTKQVHVFECAAPHEKVARHLKPVRVEETVNDRPVQ